MFTFACDQPDRSTWWGLPWESRRSWRLGTRKSDAIGNFLSVTKELRSLELRLTGHSREGDQSRVTSESLSVLLERSQETLNHMRILGLDGVPELRLVEYSLFKRVRLICLDYSFLNSLASRPQQQLPPSLNVIYFPFYVVDNSQPQNGDYEEDAILAQVLTSRHLPNRKTVRVPKGCWDYQYQEAVSTRNKELWVERRKEL